MRHSVCRDVHGIGTSITCDAPDAAVLVERRLAAFPRLPATADVSIELDTCGTPSSLEPAGDARVVHETPRGSVLYSDSQDELWVAYGRSGTAHCLPGAGTARISVSRAEADWQWVASRPLLTLCLLELLKHRGLYPLHAAAVARGDRAVLVAGPSGAGKSTLALALAMAGWSFLGDDLVFLRGAQAPLEILAFPDEIDASDTTLRLFPQLGSPEAWPRLEGYAKRQLAPGAFEPAAVVERATPAAVVLPRLGTSDAHSIERVGPEDLLLELVPNVLLTAAKPSQQHLDLLARLAREVPAHRLTLGRSLEGLPRLFDELLEERPPAV
jgi:hypothetical protein